MSVTLQGQYLGHLKTELTHGPSNQTLKTAAPVDNNGDGSSFSPTDLVAAALGSCVITIMAIVAERHKIDFTGVRFQIEKHMETSPRRIGRLPLQIHMPKGLSKNDRQRLENAAATCPVAQSLHPDVQKEIQFIYPDEPSA